MQVALFNNQKIIQKRNSQQRNSSDSTTFSGTGNNFLNKVSKPLQALDANPIVGVIVLDILTAIAPNTIIDTFKRNAAQGFETFRRESSGLIINCLLPGIAVLTVAYAMKKKILGEEFKHIPVHKVWANTNSIDEGVRNWKKVSHMQNKEDRIRAFVEKSFENIQDDEKSFAKIGTIEEQKQAAECKKEAIDKLVKEILNPEVKKETGFKKFMKDVKGLVPGHKDESINVEINPKKLNELHDIFAKAYGSSKNVVIKISKGDTLSTNMKNHIRNTFSFASAFDDKAIKPDNIDKFAEKMKKLVKGKTLITMLGVGALALSMQAINRAITEKSTGRKGYSGYKNLDGGDIQTPEDKAKLDIGKLVSSAWFLSLGFLSMGKLTTPGKFDFAAPRTTVDQARTLSLTTDVGRVAAADETTELKDTTVRDTIIFLNLYVVGDYVNKMAVEGIQKWYKSKKNIDLNLFNEAPKLDKNAGPIKKFFNWVQGKSIKSFEEIEGTVAKGAEKQLRKNIVTASTLLSLGYSLGALGIAAPLLIAHMTNKNREKELAEAKRRKAQMSSFENSSKPTLKANTVK